MSLFRSSEGGRRAPRLPVDMEGFLSGRARRPVKLIDLSIGGCLVQCEAPLKPGAILDLNLRWDADPFRAKVRVIESSLDGGAAPPGSSRYLAGLEFLSLPAQDETRLRRFLENERRRRRSGPAPAE